MRLTILLILFHSFLASAQAGIIDVSLDPDTVGQGRTLSVKTVFTRRPDAVGGEFLGKKMPLFRVDSLTYRALVGIPVGLEPGLHEMVIRAHRASEGEPQHFRLESRLAIVVSRVQFRKDTVDLPRPAADKLTSENLSREGSVIGPRFRKYSGIKMWQREFILPARGAISSPFGRQRVYGGNELSWPHKGVDIAAALGDSVRSCGEGTTILCKDFVVHGKTVMVDHGHGVVSIYCHMNEIKIRPGDVLKRGELIGTVGETGVSTGPHLHWGVSVGNVRVDPLEWVQRYIR